MDTFSRFAFEHPLKSVYVFTNIVKKCDICRREVHGDAYSGKRNKGREFFIHGRCAKLPKEHPLKSVYVFTDTVKKCYICRREVHDDAFSGKSDKGREFFIHKRCFELPEKVTHPFHLHALTLRKQPVNKPRCKICKTTGNFLYCCSDCDYALDVKCGSLTPARDVQNLCSSDCLVPYQGLDHFRYVCQVCQLVIKGLVYFDPKSGRILHESCGNLPEEIHHPFHSSHPLTLVRRNDFDDSSEQFTCYACGQKSWTSHYLCSSSECDFCLDVHCAFLKPTNDDNESRHDVVVHAHQHPLVRCDQPKSLVINCTACDKRCESSVYVCIECHVLLDESCVTLPRRLQHPFHRQHPLKLVHTSNTYLHCNACRKPSRGSRYVCLRCFFAIHTTCAWPVPPTINSEVHKHPLAFLGMPKKKFSCHQCGRDNSTTPFCCCLECDYYIHLHCLPELPHELKHEHHRHSINFNTSPIKDSPDEDEEAELYCNACEKRRNLIDPTYHCHCGYFVAHIHCLTSEILSHLESSSKKTIGKEDEMTKRSTVTCSILDADGQIIFAELDSDIARFDKEIARFDKEIKEQKKKLEALKGQREGKAKHKQFVASICNLK